MTTHAERNQTQAQGKRGRLDLQGRRRLPVQVLLGYDPATGKPQVKKARVKTHAEAVDKLQELQAKNRQGQPAHSGSATLQAFVDHWLENKVQPFRAPKTHEQYRWVLETHVLPSLGKKRVDKIRRSVVQAFVASLSKQQMKSRSKDPVALCIGVADGLDCRRWSNSAPLLRLVPVENCTT